MPTIVRAAPPGGPSLTVSSTSGLSVRIRLLLSGIAAAERTGRGFAMPWLRTKDCGAAYHELFENDWPVHETRPEERP